MKLHLFLYRFESRRQSSRSAKRSCHRVRESLRYEKREKFDFASFSFNRDRDATMHSVFPGLPASLRPVLEDALPAYSDAVAQLDLALNASHPASSLFVHAPSNQKLVAAIVQERLSRRAVVHDAPTVQDALPKVVAVDLQDLRSPRVLYDRVLNLFAAWEAEARWEAKLPNVAENWNARQDGVSVREQRENSGDVGGGADEMERGEREWTVCWDNDSEDPSLTAANSSRTNESLDGFYQGLRDIATIGGAGTPPQRRYLIVENANFLEDLASAGSHQGAPKETGIGMTFAAALLQLERLVRRARMTSGVNRMLTECAQRATVANPDYGHSHFDVELDEATRSDGRSDGSARDGLVCTASRSNR